MKDDLPIPPNEEERVKALHDYNILDSFPAEKFDRFTKFVSVICEVPVCYISLVDSQKVWLKSKVGITINESPRANSFCQYAIMKNDFFEVEDSLKDTRFSQNPLITNKLEVRYFLAYPLVNPDGYAIGTLSVLDFKPRTLTKVQKMAVEMNAKEIMTEITLHYEKRSKLKLEKFINMSNSLVCISENGYLKMTNPTYEKMLGWTKEDLKGILFLDFVHPDDVPSALKEVVRLLRGNVTASFRNRYKKKDGTYKIIEWDAISDVMTNEIFSIGRDVSEKLEVENERKKYLNEIRDIKFALDEFAIVAITDPKGNITYANDKFCEISQYSREELIGQNHRILNSGHHPKDFFKKLWTTIGSGKVWKGEVKNRKKNGDNYWVDTTIVPFLNEQNIPYQYVEIRYDITGRVKFEEKIKELSFFQSTVLNTTDVSIMVMDPNGVLLLFNKASEETLGYSAEELIGKKISVLIHDPEELKTRAEELSQELGRKIEPAFEAIITKAKLGISDLSEWNYVNKNGSRVPVLLSVTALYDQNKNIIGYLKTARDISKRLAMENELRKAKEVAEKNVIEKDIFLANMSHEIRTPMNAIIGFADVLKSTSLLAEQSEYVNTISQAGENLLVIINDILDFSKIESGNFFLSKEQMSIKKVLKEVNQLLAVKAQEKQIALKFQEKCEIPDWVLGDQVRLTQILVNIVGNAIKFTEKGKVEVSVRVESKLDDICLVEIKVKDSGIGIPEEKQNVIFERFKQADENMTRKFGGTGLGLSITKKLVELFGGAINLKSELGKGSEFTIQIPFQVVLQVNAEEKVSEEKNIFVPDLKILLVEDNPLNQKLALKVLEKTGKITVAENGREAINLVMENSFDIILMDLQMPVMDGYLATTHIRNVLKDSTPIIGLTAHSFASEREKCIEIGMNEYLSKPYKASELIQIIKSVMKISDENQKAEEMGKESDAGDGSAEPLYNLIDLMELSGKDMVFIKEAVQIFLRDIPVDMQKVRDNLKEKKFEDIKRLSHKMKSSFGLFRADKAAELCKKIELSGDNSEIEAEIPQLARLSVKIVEALKKEFKM